MTYMRQQDNELGSGEIETTPGRVLVHFGSPPGTKYKVVHQWR